MSATDRSSYQIGEVADRVQLSLRTVRYYEEVGLVEPSGRTPGGFRLYTDDDIARLQLIKRMKPLGFTLDETRDLLAVRDGLQSGQLDDDAAAEATARLSMYAAAASAKCDELREQLAAAEEFAAALQLESKRHSGRGRR